MFANYHASVMESLLVCHLVILLVQAVTCDDFLAAMADANGEDLSGIGRWYSQAGTPTLTVTTAYDAAKKSFTISTQQVVPPTNGQPDKVPVLIPLKVRRTALWGRIS
jgi:aminopeptidase N